MAKYFSKTTNGFYSSDINSVMPHDAVPITDSQYQALLTAQANGKVIQGDTNGNPVAVDHVVSQSDQIKQQIKALEASITSRMMQEAIIGSSSVISTTVGNAFYNMTAAQAIASVRSQIATLRAQL